MVDNTLCTSDLPQRLGHNIAKRRKQIGWTQAHLAERMKMEPESISRFERGATLPSLATLELLAGELNVSVADLLAEYSDSAYSEAQRVSGWLSKLQPDVRETVLDGLQKICALLALSKSSVTRTAEGVLDKTTSHSTRLANNADQVAGYAIRPYELPK